MNSTDVVGYTHSDGYCLCLIHGSEDMEDEGNESGKVQPIFADSEWCDAPTCDTCGEELEVIVISYPEEEYFWHGRG